MEVVTATMDHVADIYPRLRADDLAEVAALCPTDPRRMLEASLDLSHGAWVWMVDGKPGAIWGVQSIELQMCALWMLSTDAVPKNSRFIARYSKAIIKDLLHVYRGVEVLVDARYAVSLRWLEWLGFSLGEARPTGPLGLPFYRALRFAEEN